MKIVNTLLNDDGGYLACILKAMADQEKEVLDGLASGQDPAQVRCLQPKPTQPTPMLLSMTLIISLGL